MQHVFFPFLFCLSFFLFFLVGFFAVGGMWLVGRMVRIKLETLFVLDLERERDREGWGCLLDGRG